MTHSTESIVNSAGVVCRGVYTVYVLNESPSPFIQKVNGFITPAHPSGLYAKTRKRRGRWTDPLRPPRSPLRLPAQRPPSGSYTGPCYIRRGWWCTDCRSCVAGAACGVAWCGAQHTGPSLSLLTALRGLCSALRGCASWLAPVLTVYPYSTGGTLENQSVPSAHRDRTRQFYRSLLLGEMSRDDENRGHSPARSGV